MNISTALTIIGIVATVLFGIWSLVIVIRRRYPGEITFLIENCIGLFDTIVKNFSELKVLYQEKPVSQGIVLLKGTFLNSGKKDIASEMVEKEITLGLPEDFKWLAAKTVGSSPNMKTSVEVEPNSLRFSTGLFRCQEYFKFEALAEIPIPPANKSIENKLETGISPSHRIADTGKIRVVSLPSDQNDAKDSRPSIISSFIFLFISIVLGIFAYFYKPPSKLNFLITQKDGSIIEVAAEPRQDGTIHIESKIHNINERVDAKKFFSRSDIQPKIVPDNEQKHSIFSLVLLLIIFLIITLFFDLRNYCKRKRLRKQINLD